MADEAKQNQTLEERRQKSREWLKGEIDTALKLLLGDKQPAPAPVPKSPARITEEERLAQISNDDYPKIKDILTNFTYEAYAHPPKRLSDDLNAGSEHPKQKISEEEYNELRGKAIYASALLPHFEYIVNHPAGIKEGNVDIIKRNADLISSPVIDFFVKIGQADVCKEELQKFSKAASELPAAAQKNFDDHKKPVEEKKEKPDASINFAPLKQITLNGNFDGSFKPSPNLGINSNIDISIV